MRGSFFLWFRSFLPFHWYDISWLINHSLHQHAQQFGIPTKPIIWCYQFLYVRIAVVIYPKSILTVNVNEIRCRAKCIMHLHWAHELLSIKLNSKAFHQRIGYHQSNSMYKEQCKSAHKIPNTCGSGEMGHFSPNPESEKCISLINGIFTFIRRC